MLNTIDSDTSASEIDNMKQTSPASSTTATVILSDGSDEQRYKHTQSLSIVETPIRRNGYGNSYNIVSPESNDDIHFHQNHNNARYHNKPKNRRTLKRNKQNKKINYEHNLCYEGDLEENNHRCYYSPSKSKRKNKTRSPRSILLDNLTLPIAVSPDNKPQHYRNNSGSNVLPITTSSNSLIDTPEIQRHSPSSFSSLMGQDTHKRQNPTQVRSLLVSPRRILSIIMIMIIILCNIIAYTKFHAFTFNYSKHINNNNVQQSSSTRRIIHYDNPGNNNKLIIRKNRIIDTYPTEFSDNTQLYSTLDSDDPAISSTIESNKRSNVEDNNCKPMKEWQTSFYPTCSTIHEINFEEEDVILVGKKGYWRNAWVYNDDTMMDDSKVVVKTLRYVHNYEKSFYEHNRIDAISMERLTKSSHVVNIYGFCGNSVVTEYANGPRLGSIADKARSAMKKQKEDDISADLRLLQYAIDIAQGIADIHEIDYPYNQTSSSNNATFIHLDINPANVIVTTSKHKAQLKINDFNIGILNTYNPSTKKTCGFTNHEYPNPQWRSPEEQYLFLNKFNKNKSKIKKKLNEKVDVFSMGHLFYRLICGHDPWNKLEPGGMPDKKELSIKVSKGILPAIPQSVKESKNSVIKSIHKAMMKCYTYDPKNRPSARAIANDLVHVYESLVSKNKN